MSEHYGPYRLKSYPCAICSCRENVPILRKTGVAVIQEFQIVRCAQCRHVYVDPRIADEDLGSLYDDRYYRGEGFDSTIDYLKVGDVGKDFEAACIIETVADAFGGSLGGVRWLDFGCGTGILVEKAVARGAEAVGHDDSLFALNVCRTKNLEVVERDELDRLQGGGPSTW